MCYAVSNTGASTVQVPPEGTVTITILSDVGPTTCSKNSQELPREIKAIKSKIDELKRLIDNLEQRLDGRNSFPYQFNKGSQGGSNYFPGNFDSPFSNPYWDKNWDRNRDDRDEWVNNFWNPNNQDPVTSEIFRSMIKDLESELQSLEDELESLQGFHEDSRGSSDPFITAAPQTAGAVAAATRIVVDQASKAQQASQTATTQAREAASAATTVADDAARLSDQLVTGQPVSPQAKAASELLVRSAKEAEATAQKSEAEAKKAQAAAAAVETSAVATVQKAEDASVNAGGTATSVGATAEPPRDTISQRDAQTIGKYLPILNVIDDYRMLPGRENPGYFFENYSKSDQPKDNKFTINALEWASKNDSQFALDPSNPQSNSWWEKIQSATGTNYTKEKRQEFVDAATRVWDSAKFKTNPWDAIPGTHLESDNNIWERNPFIKPEFWGDRANGSV